MTSSPCKQDCPNRSAMCHSECKAYLEYETIHKREVVEEGNKRWIGRLGYDEFKKPKR